MRSIVFGPKRRVLSFDLSPSSWPPSLSSLSLSSFRACSPLAPPVLLDHPPHPKRNRDDSRSLWSGPPRDARRSPFVPSLLPPTKSSPVPPARKALACVGTDLKEAQLDLGRHISRPKIVERIFPSLPPHHPPPPSHSTSTDRLPSLDSTTDTPSASPRSSPPTRASDELILPTCTPQDPRGLKPPVAR